jgi:hypothetical protein
MSAISVAETRYSKKVQVLQECKAQVEGFALLEAQTVSLASPKGQVILKKGRLSTKHAHTAPDKGRLFDVIGDAEGFHSPYDTRQFRKKNVGRFIRKYLTSGHPTHQRLKQLLKPCEWSPTIWPCESDSARRRTTIGWDWDGLHIAPCPTPDHSNACWADDAELARLIELAKTPHSWYDPPLPSRLTTPRSKSDA